MPGIKQLLKNNAFIQHQLEVGDKMIELELLGGPTSALYWGNSISIKKFDLTQN